MCIRDRLHILRTKDRTAHSSIALDDSIFTVRMTAGIAVCGILGNGGSHHRLIPVSYTHLTSSQERTGDLEVMIWEMNFCLFSTVCQRYASKVPSVT